MQRRLNVLLIEDDPDYAMLMNLYMNEACGDSMSYLMEFAETLQSSISLLSAKEFDIVLLDLVLPDSKGLESLSRLRAVRPGIPIVVLTNLDQQKFGLDAIALGAQDFLVKHDVDAVKLGRAIGYAYERGRVYRQMENLVEVSPDGMLVLDDSGIVRYANAAAGALHGREPKSLVGEKFDHPLRAGAPRQTQLEVGGEKKSVEIRMARAEWRGEACWLASLRDYSELRKLEQLRAEVKERRRLDELKDKLLSTVSHELRTPLTVVQAVVSSLRDGLAGPLAPKQSQLVARADRHIKRLGRIILNFLDLSRLESGRAGVVRRKVDLKELVEAVAEEFALTQKDKEVSLRLDLAPDLPPVYADPDLVMQVLGNLIDNAVRFARHQITLWIVQTSPDDVTICVLDDGPGIPKDKSEGLFDKFVQLERPKGGGGYKGTGLGLSICKEIVEAHGGRIWAENVDGGGAGFYFTLSIRPPAPGSQSEKRYAKTGN